MYRATRNIAAFFIICITLVLASSCTAPMSQPEEQLSATTRFIAHRGLSSLYYENSELSFIMAGQSAFFWGIETDIWQTADGVWVCSHDENPFEDSSIKLGNITYAEAALIPLKSIGGEQIESVYLCTLERYLAICAEYSKVAVIELKFRADTQRLEALTAFISSRFSLDRVMFISFHSANITSLIALEGNISAQVLVSSATSAALYINSGYHIGISKNAVLDSIIASCKQRGLLINIWTVNDIQTARFYLEKEVDFVTTDYIFDFSAID